MSNYNYDDIKLNPATVGTSVALHLFFPQQNDQLLHPVRINTGYKNTTAKSSDSWHHSLEIEPKPTNSLTDASFYAVYLSDLLVNKSIASKAMQYR